MKMNESSEIGLVEIEIGNEVLPIDATGSHVLEESNSMNDCEIEMLVLAGKAVGLESPTGSQPNDTCTKQKEETIFPEQPTPVPVVDTTIESTLSNKDNQVGAELVPFPVAASENPIETQEVPPLVHSPPTVKLPTPAPVTVRASASVPNNTRVANHEPEVEVEKVEGEERHQPFLLFNHGPNLVTGKIYVSITQGRASLWKYNGLSFDPVGLPAVTEMISDCTKENVAQDVNTNVPSSSTDQ